MSIRCFIAIELGDEIHREITRLQERLRRDIRANERDVKWVRPENIHLTLKFLGEVPDSDIPDICQAVEKAVETFHPFKLDVAGCGCFPPRGAARVLWVGVSEGDTPLPDLQEAVASELEPLGHPPENRPFSAHLTLARIKTAPAGHLVSHTVDTLEMVRLGSQEVTALTVFQSELTRGGPMYTPLHHADLGK